jgi:hypothetical protein
MRTNLRISRHGRLLFEGTYEISDADSLGRACSDAWTQLLQRQVAKATSVGAAVDMLDQAVRDDLNGTQISFAKA